MSKSKQYIEPNDDAINVEDLNIGVHLEVIYPRRDILAINESVTANVNTGWVDAKLMTGKDGVLTTTYTDISPMEIEMGGHTESIGIESINIKYSSWYFPEVDIKFVDIRGNSVLNPMERTNDPYTNATNENNSLMESFFMFPYPVFKLTVKGVYGAPVTYQLAVRDVRSNFSSENGNFEINVKLIGYMYGYMTDIPMQYLWIAPYIKYNTDEKLGLFQGTNYEIPRFSELTGKIADAVNNINNDDDIGSIKEQISRANNKLGVLNALINEYAAFEILLRNTDKFVFSETRNNNIILVSCNPNETLNNHVSDNISLFVKQVHKIISLWEEIKVEYSNVDLQIVKNVNLTDESFLNVNGFQSVELYCHANDKNILKQLQLGMIEQLDNLKENHEDAIKKIYENTLGWIPSIKNIFELVLAHFNKFHENVKKCCDNIKQHSSSRKLKNLTYNHDCNANTSNMTAYPFPGFYGNNNEYIWLEDVTGSNVPFYDEVELVNSIIRATELSADEEDVNFEKLESITKWENYPRQGIPNLVYDLKNPINIYDRLEYSNAVKSTDDIPYLIKLLLRRIVLKQLIGTHSMSVDDETFGKIEAYNLLGTGKIISTYFENQDFWYSTMSWKSEMEEYAKKFLKGILPDEKEQIIRKNIVTDIFAYDDNGRVNGSGETGEFLFDKDFDAYSTWISQASSFLVNKNAHGFSEVFPYTKENVKPYLGDVEIRGTDILSYRKANKYGFYIEDEKGKEGVYMPYTSCAAGSISGSTQLFEEDYFSKDFQDMDFIDTMPIYKDEFAKKLYSFAAYPSFKNPIGDIKESRRIVSSFCKSIGFFSGKPLEKDYYFGCYKMPYLLYVLNNLDNEEYKEEILNFAKELYDNLANRRGITKDKGKLIKKIDETGVGEGKYGYVKHLTDDQKKYIKGLFSKEVYFRVKDYGEDNIIDDKTTPATLEFSYDDNINTVITAFIGVLTSEGMIPQKESESESVGMVENQTGDKLQVYQTLKDLYDRWKFGSSESITSLISIDDFLFRDTLNNDVSDKTFLDPMTLVNIMKTVQAGDKRINLYTFLNEICAEAGFQMTALPVNVYKVFKDEEALRNVFKPQQYFATNNDTMRTTYVATYSHRPSQHLNFRTNRSEYPDDSVDFTNELVESINGKNDGSKINVFGVTYGLGTQRIFKNISPSMDKPIVTEQSIMSTLKISEMGASGGTTFKGVRPVNTFDIYSNHSYTCKVEMLGCAQIMPLMYFQLNNIPLFKGGYWIVNVEHNITKGEMKTTFTGQRLNRHQFNLDNISTINNRLAMSVNSENYTPTDGKAKWQTSNVDGAANNIQTSANSENAEYSKEKTKIFIVPGHYMSLPGKESPDFVKIDANGNVIEDNVNEIFSGVKPETSKIIPTVVGFENVGMLYEYPSHSLPDVLDPFDKDGNEVFRYREYWGNIKIAVDIAQRLKNEGFNVEVLGKIDRDKPQYQWPSTKVNNHIRTNGAGSCIVINIHSNAAAAKEGQWSTGNRWEIYSQGGEFATGTYIGTSEYLADCIGLAMQKAFNSDREFIPKVNGKEMTITTNSKKFVNRQSRISVMCVIPPAVLSENLFHNTKEHVRFLGTRRGREILVNGHVNGIIDFFNNIKNLKK